MLPQFGLAAGAAAWKAGHEAVRTGALALDDLPEAERDQRLDTYAAAQSRIYMRDTVAAHALTPAQGVRIFWVYLYAFKRGALDQALDGGALLRGS